MQLIDDAIQLLQEKSWGRGPQRRRQQRICIRDALNLAAMRLPNGLNYASDHVAVAHLHACRAVTEVLCARVGAHISMEHWNDTIAKDVNEVLEVLKLAGERVDLEQEQHRGKAL